MRAGRRRRGPSRPFCPFLRPERAVRRKPAPLPSRIGGKRRFAFIGQGALYQKGRNPANPRAKVPGTVRKGRFFTPLQTHNTLEHPPYTRSSPFPNNASILNGRLPFAIALTGIRLPRSFSRLTDDANLLYKAKEGRLKRLCAPASLIFFAKAVVRRRNGGSGESVYEKSVESRRPIDYTRTKCAWHLHLFTLRLWAAKAPFRE